MLIRIVDRWRVAVRSEVKDLSERFHANSCLIEQKRIVFARIPVTIDAVDPILIFYEPAITGSHIAPELSVIENQSANVTEPHRGIGFGG